MLEKLLEIFRSIPAPLVIAAAFIMPALETALLLGILVPGELIVIAAGIRAARADVPLAAVVGAAVAGAIVGDSIGYLLGRHFRRQITKQHFAKRWSRAQDWLKRKGKPAIFFARFTAFVRSVMPPAAGASKISYRDFALWNSPAGVIWGSGSALLGYYAAIHSEVVLRWAMELGAVLLGLAIVAAILYLRRRRTRRKSSRLSERRSTPRRGRNRANG